MLQSPYPIKIAFDLSKAWQESVLRYSFRIRSIPFLRLPFSFVFHSKIKIKGMARVPFQGAPVLPSFFKSGLHLLPKLGEKGASLDGYMVVSPLSSRHRSRSIGYFSYRIVTPEVTICHPTLYRGCIG